MWDNLVYQSTVGSIDRKDVPVTHAASRDVTVDDVGLVVPGTEHDLT